MRNYLAFISTAAIVLGLILARSVVAQSFDYAISALKVSPNREQIAKGTIFGELQIYDSSTRMATQTLQTVGDDIFDIQWSPDGSMIAAISFYGLVSVWNVSSGEPVFEVNISDPSYFDLPLSELVSVSWSPDGYKLAVSGQVAGSMIMDSNTGMPLLYLPTGETYSNTWSPSLNLTTASLIGIQVWNDENLVSQVPGIGRTQIPGIAPFLVSSGSNPTLVASLVTVFDSETPDSAHTVVRIYEAPLLHLISSFEVPIAEEPPGRIEWSTNDTYFAVSGFNGFVWVWESSTLNLIDHFPVGDAVRAFDWLSDTEIVYATNDGFLNVVTVGEFPTPTLVPTATPTETETPTPTPTATFTPTPSATPAALQRLRLTSLCSANPALTRRWRVRNSNAYDVAFTWDVYQAGQSGSGTVPAAQGGVQGEVIFETTTVPNSPNTVRIFVNGAQQDVKASSGAAC